MADEAGFEIKFGTGRTMDLEAIRNQRSALMPDGEHAWVIMAAYGLDDPEAALDDMELGPEQFVGLSQIHCLLCGEEYRSVNRHHKCPQKWMKK